MKVLLVNPIITTFKREIDFPLNLIYLASGLKQSPLGISVTPIDLTFEYFRQKLEGVPLFRAQELCIERAWRENGPFDLVGIGGLCDNFHLSVRLAEFVKNKYSVPVVMGGPQATFVADEILKAFPFVDFVILNDGIDPLLKLCELLGERSFEKVPALVYRGPKTGSIIRNARTESALNVLTVQPDYNFLPLAEYLTINPELSIPVLAGTGCPFQCTYCSTSLMWDRRYRVIAPKIIAERVLRLKKSFPGVRYNLVHDNLLVSKSFARRLYPEMAKAGVVWGCSSRLEHIAGDRGLMRNLAAAGCEGIFIGIETASPEIQRLTGKNIDVSRVVPFARDLIKYGLSPVFSFIVGFPEETDADRDKTLRLAFHLRVLQAERVNINHLFPLSGTAVAEQNRVYPGKETAYRPPQFGADGKTKALAFDNPYVFRSFWAFKERPGNTTLAPTATEKLFKYCVEHYRSFHYLFSRAGLRPSALFPVLRGKRPKRDILKKIRLLAGPESSRVFAEMFRYESLIMRMVNGRGPRKPRGSKRGFDADLKYSLSPGTGLLQSALHLPSYLEQAPAGGAACPPPRRTFLCLVDGGKEVETYEVNKELFLILKKMSGKKTRPRDLLASITESKTRKIVLDSLQRLFKMGVLLDA
jgi:radical SAM superfamily enzyme YgiQ (UPF0313 family)